jgi:hypothetical protein
MGNTNCFACVVEVWNMFSMKHHSVLYVRSVGNVQHIHDWGLTFCSHFILPVPRQTTFCTECCMICSPLNDMAAFASVCFNADHNGTCTYSKFARHGHHKLKFTLHIQNDLTAVLAKEVTANDYGLHTLY